MSDTAWLQAMLDFEAARAHEEADAGLPSSTLPQKRNPVRAVLILALSSLHVDPRRMAENLTSDGGLVMAENLALQLSRHATRSAARDVVRRCNEESIKRHVAFADVVRHDPQVRRHLSEDQIANALDPERYLGSIDALIQRAQDVHGAAGVHP